jgi:hypothetical protein
MTPCTDPFMCNWPGWTHPRDTWQMLTCRRYCLWCNGIGGVWATIREPPWKECSFCRGAGYLEARCVFPYPWKQREGCLPPPKFAWLGAASSLEGWHACA